VNFQPIDWILLGVLFLMPLAGGYLCRKLVRGVSDYLVAGRNVGRYLGLGTDSMQSIGAVTILAYWQMNYKSGFAGQWWYLLTPAAGILVALTGWGIYRFRETRAMTLGELVGMRYGPNARIFFGAVAFLAGVVNMGIFPAVGAGFFVYFCGLPETIAISGIEVSTTLVVILLFESVAVAICFWGGQVTVVVTDFFQALFLNAMLVAIAVVLYRTFTWEQFAQAYTSVPNGDSLLHPFRSDVQNEFGPTFFLIHVYYWMVYSVISWSPNSMQVSSARDAHEGRMMRVLLHVRNLAMMGLGLFVLPLAAFVLLHHPDFASQAASVETAVAAIGNEQVRSQMLIPAAVAQMLPAGLLGALAGAMLFAIITTDDTYFLAWSSLLIQDVVIPLRRKPLSPRQHLWWLRGAVLVVALFVVTFSQLFDQVDNIFMFMDISASLYTGAAGVVLLGALYWKRGTTAAAWATMAVGLCLSAAGFIYRSIDPSFLDGRIMAFWVSVLCIGVYLSVSLLGPRAKAFDVEGLLHRGRERFQPPKADRILIRCIYALVALFLAIHLGVGLYNLSNDVPTSSWLWFWPKYLVVMFCLGTLFLLWITWGGVRDLTRLFRSMRAPKDADGGRSD
jgi:SSS family solute:Na+ symporter